MTDREYLRLERFILKNKNRKLSGHAILYYPVETTNKLEYTYPSLFILFKNYKGKLVENGYIAGTHYRHLRKISLNAKDEYHTDYF